MRWVFGKISIQILNPFWPKNNYLKNTERNFDTSALRLTVKWNEVKWNGSKIAFALSLLQPLLWQANKFVAKWLELRSRKESWLLAKYISIMVQSKTFTIAPRDEDFNEDDISNANSVQMTSMKNSTKN